MPEHPPGYYYDDGAGVYINRVTMKAVPASKIAGLLDQSLGAAEGRLGMVLERTKEGFSSPWMAVRQAQRELKTMYLENAALGSGGWHKMTAKEWGRVGGLLRGEYRRMESFVKEIAEGKLSQAEINARLHMYVGNARKLMYKIQQERATPMIPRQNVLIEKRNLGTAEHCPDCKRYHEMGWQPQGVLPVPGESSVCDGACRCSMERREINRHDEAEWVGTRR